MQSQEELARGERALIAANGRLHTSASLDLLGAVPVFRQNVRSLDRSVQIAFQLVNGGRRILSQAEPFADGSGRLNVPLRSGTVPLPQIRSLTASVKELTFALDDRPDRSSRWLVGPVRDLESDVWAEVSERRAQLVSVGRGLDVLSEMAGGNGARRYLIAVANLAEMRGSGGMILSYGVLAGSDGKISLERFGQIDELRIDRPVELDPVPAFVDQFPRLQPTREWRNANLTPDFRQSGPVLEAMAAAATGQAFDGVIQVDSFGLAAILRGVGPVVVPGLTTLTADNAVALTLNDAYVRFPDRTAREDYLEDAARLTFDRLLTGDYPSLRVLGEALGEAVQQRHVLVHARDPKVERTFVNLGAGGGLPDPGRDFAHLTVQNFSATKLDYYLDTSMRIRGTRRPGRQDTLSFDLQITNRAPRGGTSQYVFGPFLPDVVAGQYRGLVSLHVPAGAAAVKVSPGSRAAPSVAAQGDTTVISFTTDLEPGETERVRLEVRLPPVPGADYRFSVVPQPRVRPTVVDVDLGSPAGRLRRSGPLASAVELG